MINSRFLTWCELMGITDVCGDVPRRFLQPRNREEKVKDVITSLEVPTKTEVVSKESSLAVTSEDILSEKVQEVVSSCHSLKD